jgi:hypothetical protein
VFAASLGAVAIGARASAETAEEAPSPSASIRASSTAPATMTPPATSASASASASNHTELSLGAPPGPDFNPREGLDPYPSVGRYISYSIAFTSEALLNAGVVCSNAVERCMIGGGGGLELGAAYRNLATSIGAVYEVTFHDSHSIYQRGVLQQIRGEWRYRPKLAILGDEVSPVLGAGAGIAVYGDNWAIATFGPSGSLFAGVEVELGVKLSFLASLAYHPVYFRKFSDASGQERTAGVVHFLGINLGLELHEPL